VEQVDVWAKDIKLEGVVLNQFNACKGELLELARNQVKDPFARVVWSPTYSQLDVFGIQLDLLPSRSPFSLSLPSVPIISDGTKQESRSITNSDFLKCLEDQMAFYDIYVNLTNRAIDAYVKAGRRKFALRLHGSLAALDVLVMTVVPSPLIPSHRSHSQSSKSIAFRHSNIFIAASSLRAA
jgi:trafficking protein particle complex subunit 10